MTNLGEYFEVIFKYVPNDVLVTLLEIPLLRDQVLKKLYSTIRITGRLDGILIKVHHGPLLDLDRIPVLKSPMEYVNLLEQHQAITPKELIVDDPSIALLLARQYPHSLKGVGVHINLDTKENHLQYMIQFFKEYKKTPFLVTSLEYHYFGNMAPYDDDTETEFYAGLNNITIPHVDDKVQEMLMTDIFMNDLSIERFPNLTSLSLRYLMFPDDDYDKFPARLKKLEMHLCLFDPIPMGPQKPSNGKRLLKLDLPENLIELELRLQDDNNRGAATVDISHLLKLEKVSVSSKTSDNVHCYLKLPSNLKEARFESGHFMVTKLNVMCPKLNSLQIEESIIQKKELPFLVRYLPETLQKLTIPIKAFTVLPPRKNITKLKQDKQKRVMYELRDPQIKLPSSLREFTISAFRNDYPSSFEIDFQVNELPNLEDLFTSFCSQLTIKGKFPVNLTSLHLNAYDAGLEQLKFLSKLTKLTITGLTVVKNFTFKLPDSLKFLEISEGNWETIHIDAPDLRELVLTQQNIPVLNESVVTFPDTIKKLKLQDCNIMKIAMELPDSLEELDLETNLLEDIHYLPLGLKRLNMSLNRLGSGNSIANFPLSLETLDLSSCKIDGEWIRRLNLAILTNLKELNLMFSSLYELNPNWLPKSLVVLQLNRSGLVSLKSRLTMLENLEQLDLEGNGIGYCFEDFRRSGKIFGDAIRYVKLNKTGLIKPTADAIFRELNKKPHFEFLDVDIGLVPKMSSSFPSKVRKIGCLMDNRLV